MKCANSIYPLNQHEAQMRRDYLLRANAELNSLVSQIEVANELFGIESNKMKFWMDIHKTVDARTTVVLLTANKSAVRGTSFPGCFFHATNSEGRLS